MTDTIGTTSRDYSTITSWEASLSAHSGDDVTGECYDDSAFDERFDIDDTTPTTITLTVASGERHDGTAGTGARIIYSGSTNRTIYINPGTVQVDLSWIELDQSSITGGVVQHECIFAKLSTIHNLIVHSHTNDRNSYGVFFDHPSAVIHNCILYDILSTHTGVYAAAGIGSQNALDSYHCTTFNIKNNSGSGSCYGQNIITGPTTNCISVDTGGTTTGTKSDFNSATPTYSLSSDTTASGTGCLTEKASSDQFVSTTGGSEDLHLKAGADAIAAGTDLGTTPTGVQFDIDGYDRDTEAVTWDMGADQSPPNAITGITRIRSRASHARPSYKSGFAKNAAESAHPELWKGLVGAWHPGLGPTGSQLLDHSGFSNHGTLTNMEPNTDWVASEKGTVLDFDGLNESVDMAATPILNFDVTLAIWLSPDDLTTAQYITSFGSGNEFSMICGYQDNYYNLFGGAYPTGSASDSQMPMSGTGIWDFVAWTKKGTNLKGYVNGIQKIDVTITAGDFSPSSGFAIGYRRGFYQWFNGRFSDARVYNRALSSQEIQALAKRPGIAYERHVLPPFPTGLEAVGPSIPILAYHYNHHLGSMT